MVLFASRSGELSLLQRCLAAMGVAVLLLLLAAAVSPALHQHLHHGHATQPATSEHSCAVVLFASGLTAAVATLWLAAVPVIWRALARVPAAVVLPPAPRYLRRPERGPPVELSRLRRAR